MSVTALHEPPPADASAQELTATMQTLEGELMHMMDGWARAEEAMIRTTARIERLKAPRRLEWKRQPPPNMAGVKLTKEDLDALVLNWLWEENEQLMEEQLNAEALCAAYQTKERVASKALSSKQTRLNADIKLGR